MATFNAIPGLSSIPIIGELFKSRDKSKSKTELLVMVTPEIIDPLEPEDPKPVPVMPLEFLEAIPAGTKLKHDGTVSKKK
jgi:pilus assembly protein CpaC